MRCKSVLERLDDHVDGILPATESEAIREHLDDCRDCRDEALAVNAASSSLSTWNDIEPPADCYDKILARLEALPLEAFERPAAPAPKNRIAKFLPWIETVTAERVRFATTSGLAAAAAVLTAVLLTQNEPRPVRRPRAEPFGMTTAATSASWFGNSNFDNGLLYPDGRPLSAPARAALARDLVGVPR